MRSPCAHGGAQACGIPASTTRSPAKILTEALGYLNSEGAISQNHRGYQWLAQVGRQDSRIGTEAVGAWYAANLHIFENIRRVASAPGDRVLAIYGQGHAKLLRHWVRESPDRVWEAIAPYLL